MRDLRALANFDNLNSYRTWEREGFQRSGFFAIFLIVLMSATMMFTVITPLIDHATRGDAHALARIMARVFTLYGVACGGLMLFAVLRLRAWKRAHPWEPPPSRSVWSYRVGTGTSVE